MRCLTKASTTKTTKTASPLLRFRFPPEFLIQGIAHTKSHCSHNKALGCHTQVIRWTDILVFPLLFNLYNPYATIAAKPAIPMGTNGASLAFRVSLDPWSSSNEERETSVLLDIVTEESSDNYKTLQVPTGFLYILFHILFHYDIEGPQYAISCLQCLPLAWVCKMCTFSCGPLFTLVSPQSDN